MDVFGSIAHIFGHICQKSNDVMVGDSFDFFDAFDAEISFSLNILQCVIRNDAQFIHRLAGQNFYLQHCSEFVFQSPDMTHLGMSITFDHFFVSPRKIGVFCNKNRKKACLRSSSLINKLFYPLIS